MINFIKYRNLRLSEFCSMSESRGILDRLVIFAENTQIVTDLALKHDTSKTLSNNSETVQNLP